MDIVSYNRTGLLPVTPRPRRAPPVPPAPPPPGPADASRIAWVDTAKGICIVLVVMMHATLGVEAEMGATGFMHWAVAFSKPFRMPDFFLVSGLFLSRVIDRDWRSYADKRVVHFVYFYVLWLVIQSAFKVGQVSGGSPSGFAWHLAQGLVEPFSTLWFIYILAVFSVVTKLLRGVPPVMVFAFAAALQIMPIETGSLVVNEFCERWVYFLAGYLFAPHVFRVADWARSHVVAALAATALWAVVNGALALTPIDLGRVSTLAELPVIGLVAGMAGALAIVAVAALLSRTVLAAPFRYAGSHSIAIYLTFFLPMAAARTLLIKTGAIDDIGVVAAIVTAVAVAVPLLLERLVRDTRLSFLYRRPDWAHLPSPRPSRAPRLAAD